MLHGQCAQFTSVCVCAAAYDRHGSITRVQFGNRGLCTLLSPFEHEVPLHFLQQGIGNYHCACALRNCSDLTPSTRLTLKVELTRIDPGLKLVGSLVSRPVLCCQNVHAGTPAWAWEFRTDRTTPSMSASTYIFSSKASPRASFCSI